MLLKISALHGFLLLLLTVLPILGSSSNEKNNAVLRRVPRRTDHVANMMNGIDLSDPEFIPDHRHGKRRVKKVLQMDGPFENPYYGFGITGPTIPRTKRFVLFPMQAFRFLLGQGNGGADDLPEPTDDQPQTTPTTSMIKPNVPPNPAQNAIIKTRVENPFNVSAFELNIFQKTIISSLGSFCPEVKTESSIMMSSIQDSVSAKVRGLRDKFPPGHWINSASLIQKLQQCSEEFGSTRRRRKSQTNPKAPQPPTTTLDPIHQYFEKEGQRLKRLTQLDVVPTPLNIITWEKLIFQILGKRCGNRLTHAERIQAQKITEVLFVVIESQRDAVKPTLHQQEMLELIDATRACYMEGSSNYMDALAGQK